MLSYYEHNTAFQTNNCNSGSNAAGAAAANTYNSNACDDSIVNKRNNDHFEFDTHSLYQRPKRTKRDSAGTKSTSCVGAATATASTFTTNNNNNNNIQYQKNIEISPLTSVNMHHTANSRSLNESEFYSETEEYMVHGYFGNGNHGVTNAAPNGGAGIIQHQRHILPAQSIIASQLPGAVMMATLTNSNNVNDYMDID
ncbi:YML053C [Saccharomyces arboricola H-6]|uniref:YML053C n=1 Tax=Saccharomyces arboricola (strain H-6 / AS 2.3317 / CBS 10644) TaxID=1160507 RepID=J8Q1C9_SACAR|nr:YML053C [Saccharomyces arboricola H-6]